MTDYSYFFKKIREKLYSGTLKQSQVDGIQTILDNTKDLSIPTVAYMLATVYHETAKKMQPLSEYGKGRDYIYGKWCKNSKGKEYCFQDSGKNTLYFKDDNSNLYYGRGLVQLTWLNNYNLATKKLHELGELPLDKNLVSEPELANDINIATNIMKLGMLQGWFTGKKLGDYITPMRIDYFNARKVINGLDCAVQIKHYAEIFEAALRTITHNE